METPKQALERAVALVGSKEKLAVAVGVTAQAVGQWDEVPPKRVIAVERATGGQVTRQALRPDLYPAEERDAA